MDMDTVLAIADTAAGDGAAPAQRLSEAEAEAVLDLARAVAHAVERKAAPLAAYTIGRALAGLPEERRLHVLAETARHIDATADA